VKELGEALKLIFAKVAGFFDILDLSFFLSGIASASALTVFLHYAKVPVTSMLTTKTGIFLAALASYGLGLVSFASGRLAQRGVTLVRKKREAEDFEERMRELLSAHGLAEQQPFKKYLSKENEKYNGIQALYTRLWAEVRHSGRVSTSLELLNSYWVKAATYDGLSVSLLGVGSNFGHNRTILRRHKFVLKEFSSRHARAGGHPERTGQIPDCPPTRA
jgi:hypothetical protein